MAFLLHDNCVDAASNHLVLSQMPVEAIHLVKCHQVQHFFDELHAEIMSPHIQEYPSPRKSWGVSNLQTEQDSIHGSLLAPSARCLHHRSLMQIPEFVNLWSSFSLYCSMHYCWTTQLAASVGTRLGAYGGKNLSPAGALALSHHWGVEVVVAAGSAPHWTAHEQLALAQGSASLLC